MRTALAVPPAGGQAVVPYPTVAVPVVVGACALVVEGADVVTSLSPESRTTTMATATSATTANTQSTTTTIGFTLRGGAGGGAWGGGRGWVIR